MRWKWDPRGESLRFFKSTRTLPFVLLVVLCESGSFESFEGRLWGGDGLIDRILPPRVLRGSLAGRRNQINTRVDNKQNVYKFY